MIPCCSKDDAMYTHVGPCPIKKEHLQAARFCGNVYDDGWLHGSEQFIDFEETNVQCAMNVVGKTLYVSYRGSDSRRDWKQNIKINMVNYPAKTNQEIHFGFLLNWISVKKDIDYKIEILLDKYKDEIDTVIFCGHSAGTICLLNAYDMAEKLQDVYSLKVKAITIGAPRIGNEEFKAAFDERVPDCTRIVLDKDIVTRFPIGILQIHDKYRHVGNPIQLRAGEILQRDTSKFEAFKWILGGIPKMNMGLVADHEISGYIQELERILEECEKHNKEDQTLL